MFAGFPPEAQSFYAGLAEDNSKAYWEAHRDVYEDAVREPLEVLTAELAREFGAAKVFRPYRDTRFSKDKSPYKLGAGAVAKEDGHVAAVRYVEVNANGLWVGAGLYHADRSQLTRLRRAIDDDKHGPQLEQIKRELEQQGWTYLPPELKTAPRGYPKDHPRIELLRCKRHAAMQKPDAGPWLHAPEAKDRVANLWRSSTPLIEWVERHAGPADDVAR